MLLFYLNLISAIFATGLAALRAMHMFQQNSYRGDTHFHWMRGRIKSFALHCLALVLVAATLLWYHIAERNMMFFSIPLFCIAIFFNRPMRKTKKPLAYTARVKRMLVTCGIIILVVSAAAIMLHHVWSIVLPLLLFACSPLLPLLANLINTPIEVAIRNYYINDAKKMLASAPNLTVIGITGSYGKTSVKYYLTTLLKGAYHTLMTPESYNTPMGITLTVRNELRATHEMFVCEMGAKWPGDIKELCDLVSPTHGIITAIGEQHLESFHTQEAIIKTKLELADAVKGKGYLFLNGDNQLLRDHLPPQDYSTYGVGAENQYRAHQIQVSRRGTTFSLTYPGGAMEGLETRLIGEHNVVNLAGVIGLALSLGVTEGQIRAQLPKIVSPPHRLAMTENNGVVIIDDAYNSNPSGCRAALDTLARFDGCKILITPGMVELGPEQNPLNHAFGAQAAAVCDHVFLIGAAQTKPIYDGLLSAGYDASHITISETVQQGIAAAYALPCSGEKIILLENDLPDNYYA